MSHEAVSDDLHYALDRKNHKKYILYFFLKQNNRERGGETTRRRSPFDLATTDASGGTTKEATSLPFSQPRVKFSARAKPLTRLKVNVSL